MVRHTEADDANDYDDHVDAFADELHEFVDLIEAYDDSWGDDETPTFDFDVTAGPTIPIPYKRHPATGDRCRNTKLYRTRQESKGIYYTLRKKYSNALWILAKSDRELSEFRD